MYIASSLHFCIHKHHCWRGLEFLAMHSLSFVNDLSHHYIVCLGWTFKYIFPSNIFIREGFAIFSWHAVAADRDSWYGWGLWKVSLVMVSVFHLTLSPWLSCFGEKSGATARDCAEFIYLSQQYLHKGRLRNLFLPCRCCWQGQLVRLGVLKSFFDHGLSISSFTCPMALLL